MNKIANALVATRGSETQPVTRLLSDWKSGDSRALERLTPLIYDELRKRAQLYMGNERKDHTLQATAIVNEAFVHLLEMDVTWANRGHFFAIAARQMRRILVDYAKRRASEKRGAGKVESLEANEAFQQLASEEDNQLLELNDALEKLSQHDEKLARIVELHYFAGLTHKQIAKYEKISEITVERSLRLGKAWLLQKMRVEPKSTLQAPQRKCS